MKDLMNEKAFEKISVIDICKGCGMNRKSFYYHFKDKYDLVNWIFYTDFITLTTMEQFENGWDLLTAVAKLFYRDQAFYRAAFKIEGQNSFKEYFFESMAPIVLFFLSDITDQEDDPDLFLSVFCDAYLSIMERWLVKGCPQSPEIYVQHLKSMLRGIAGKIIRAG